jgi:hypothetical protein
MEIILTKPTYPVIGETDPRNLIFSSKYGTLKYFVSGEFEVDIDPYEDGDFGWYYLDHNLGYYPFVELYVGNPLDKYEYCPVKSGGASTMWEITYTITENQLKVYVSTTGFYNPITFYFRYFIFKNDLDL